MNQSQRTLKAMRFATVLAAISQLLAAAVAAAPPGETPNPQDPSSANSAPDVPVPASAQSPRDQAVAQRLVLSRIDGEICWIESEGKNFLALFRESHEALLQGGLIINISSGSIVDAQPLHRELARSAVASGWAALSIQPATTDPGSPGKLVPVVSNPRLDAAFEYLVARGIKNIVVVGDASGAVEAIRYVIEKESAAISGFIGLGRWSAPLEGTDISILDIVGTRDQPAVAFKNIRREQLRRRKKRIEHLEIDGAGPVFYGYEQEIAKRVRGWLERATPGIALLQR